MKLKEIFMIHIGTLCKEKNIFLTNSHVRNLYLVLDPTLNITKLSYVFVCS